MRKLAVLAVAVAAVLETGCLVQVTKVKDASPLFREARQEAARLAGKKGPARELNVLVWDPADGELVRVSVPMWLVRKAEGHMDWDGFEVGDDEATSKVRERLRGRVALRELQRSGLGTLIEVEEEDGEQVLVWLE